MQNTTSDKRQLLAYFKAKDATEVTTVCNITGMSFTIIAPTLPNIQGLTYQCLSPLATLANAETFAFYTYKEAHKEQEQQTLAGALLSLFYHYKLRADKLSAVEANMLLSQLPAYFLSQTLNFVVNLSNKEKERISPISLAEGDPYALKNWVNVCHEILAVEFSPPIRETVTVKVRKPLLIQTVTSETRKEAKALLNSLKASNLIDTKLASVIAMSLSKNNLALLSSSLRKTIINKLYAIQTDDTDALGNIFADAASNASQQEAIVSKLMDERPSIFAEAPEVLSLSTHTLAEIIAIKKEREALKQKANTLSLVAEIKTLADIVDRDNSEDTISNEDALAHTVESDDDLLLEEAEIGELDFEDESN